MDKIELEINIGEENSVRLAIEFRYNFGAASPDPATRTTNQNSVLLVGKTFFIHMIKLGLENKGCMIIFWNNKSARILKIPFATC